MRDSTGFRKRQHTGTLCGAERSHINTVSDPLIVHRHRPVPRNQTGRRRGETAIVHFDMTYVILDEKAVSQRPRHTPPHLRSSVVSRCDLALWTRSRSRLAGSRLAVADRTIRLVRWTRLWCISISFGVVYLKNSAFHLSLLARRTAESLYSPSVIAASAQRTVCHPAACK